MYCCAGVLERALGRAHRAGGDVDAPAVQALHGDLEAFALAAQQVVGGDAHVVKADGARGLAVPAHFFFLLAVADAGVSAGTAKALMPEAPDCASPVRAMSTSTSVLPAPEMKALEPLMMYSLPTSSARVLSEAASEPAPGSVRQ
jgi:hypothetical protein